MKARYATGSDHKDYTFRVDKKLGEDMQSLTFIGTPIAWLFAVPKNSVVQNGFSLTGGRFNYTAEVKFLESGKSATISMVFNGLDAFDYLKASVRIEGSIPKLSQRGRKQTVSKFFYNHFTKGHNL